MELRQSHIKNSERACDAIFDSQESRGYRWIGAHKLRRLDLGLLLLLGLSASLHASKVTVASGITLLEPRTSGWKEKERIRCALEISEYDVPKLVSECICNSRGIERSRF